MVAGRLESTANQIEDVLREAGHIDRFLTKYPSLESAAQDGVENIWKRIRDRMSRGNY